MYRRSLYSLRSMLILLGYQPQSTSGAILASVIKGHLDFESSLRCLWSPSAKCADRLVLGFFLYRLDGLVSSPRYRPNIDETEKRDEFCRLNTDETKK